MDDEELLQDFIVEAGEILELLNEQLVELENRPQDNDLLNAVFRGFHTIKGGASFLGLNPLVEICHRAEDVFNVLRNGERLVDAGVMDVILPVLDTLNAQFDAIRSNEDAPEANPVLLQNLEALTKPEGAEHNENTETIGAVDTVKSARRNSDTSDDTVVTFGKEQKDSDISNIQTQDNESDDITDAEFEALLDVLDGVRTGVSKIPSSNTENIQQTKIPPDNQIDSDDITEEEFDKLLDGLAGARAGVKGQTPEKTPVESKSSASNSVTDGTAKNDEISEQEFEDLLDKIQAEKKLKAAESITSSDVNAKSVTPKEAIDTSAKADGGRGQPQSTTAATSSSPVQNKRENTPQTESTVRVDTKRLDDIMNMVGELVLVRNRMATLEMANADEEFSKVVANLDVVTSDLQATVMKTRMQPIKKVFGRFPRVVRDLARNLKKDVLLEMRGEETDLDKNLVEALADPLVHLIRNAVDHGIEMPDERENAGKNRSGTVVLSAEQEGDHILLTIQDDGKGMDANSLRKTAIEKGILDAETAVRLDEKECYNLIFKPGFSTKSEISDISGRGVGMDVVKTRIVQLNGSVEIDSQKGKGSVIVIKVPLTLAIMPTLMVMLEKQIFALPLANVNEIFHLDLTRTNVVDGQLVVMVRDKALPLFYLRHWLIKNGRDKQLPSEGHVVVVTMGATKIGFVVDSLIGQEEVVIKPLGALLHGMRGLAGATITGDGRISLILDIPGLMQTYARRM